MGMAVIRGKMKNSVIERYLKEVVVKQGFIWGGSSVEVGVKEIIASIEVFDIKEEKSLNGLEKALEFLAKFMEAQVTEGVPIKWRVRVLEGAEVFDIRYTENLAKVLANYMARELEARTVREKLLWERMAEKMSKMPVEGCMLKVKGRIQGSERSSEFKYRKGRVSMKTIRNKIDYGFAEGKTMYGMCSIKVWVNNEK